MLRDMGRDQKVVKRLKQLDSDCTEAELLTARDKEDELFDRMAEGLNSANARELTAAAAQKSALAYLSARGIDIGVARRLQFTQSNKLKIEFDLCTSSKDMAPIGPFSKRHFSAGCFSSLTC